jgi:hypothetical protein
LGKSVFLVTVPVKRRGEAFAPRLAAVAAPAVHDSGAVKVLSKVSTPGLS